MAIDGLALGAFLLVTGRRVDLRRRPWRQKSPPAPKPPPSRRGRRPRQGRRLMEPKPVREPPTCRTCTDCGQTKGLEAFVPIKATRTGHYGRCRECRNRRARERYHSNAD